VDAEELDAVGFRIDAPRSDVCVLNLDSRDELLENPAESLHERPLVDVADVLVLNPALSPPRRAKNSSIRRRRLPAGSEDIRSFESFPSLIRARVRS